QVSTLSKRHMRPACGMSVRISALSMGIFSWRWRLIPKRIKVEPVIRRKPRVVLQTIGVALHPTLDLLQAPVAIQDYFISQLLEVNLVTVPPAVNAEKQDNMATHNRRQHSLAGGVSRGRGLELPWR